MSPSGGTDGQLPPGSLHSHSLAATGCATSSSSTRRHCCQKTKAIAYHDGTYRLDPFQPGVFSTQAHPTHFNYSYFGSFCQFPIGQSFIDSIYDELVDPIHSVILLVSLVEAEDKLIDVSMHMLLAPGMIDAVVASFHNRPNALNPVRMDTPIHVLPDLVLDKPVIVGAFQSRI